MKEKEKKNSEPKTSTSQRNLLQELLHHIQGKNEKSFCDYCSSVFKRIFKGNKPLNSGHGQFFIRFSIDE